MKNYTVLIVVFMLTLNVTSQELNIETKSVTLDNLITFIIENIDTKNEESLAPSYNITFLLQTPENNLILEDKVILKQAFKLISKRLTKDDNISIVTYSGINGIALKKRQPKDIKGILYTIDNLKSSVKEFHKDGIELAYEYSKNNFEINAKNMVVMIRVPNSGTDASPIAQNLKKPKKKNNAVLITALALLPEIISVIKD